jgi:hypothetical protein
VMIAYGHKKVTNLDAPLAQNHINLSLCQRPGPLLFHLAATFSRLSHLCLCCLYLSFRRPESRSHIPVFIILEFWFHLFGFLLSSHYWAVPIQRMVEVCVQLIMLDLFHCRYISPIKMCLCINMHKNSI